MIAYIQTNRVSIGELLSGTFHELSQIPRELALYFAAFAALGLLSDLFPMMIALISPLAFFGYFVGQYYLYQTLLKRNGLLMDTRFKVFRFFAMAIILSIPIMIGANLFYIPGIMLAAKWVMAPSILVSQDRGLFDAMGDSWHASSNNLVPLSVAFGLLVAGWTVGLSISIAAGVPFLSMSGFASGYTGFQTMFWVTMHILPVLLMGLSVTAYRALMQPADTLAEVFE